MNAEKKLLFLVFGFCKVAYFLFSSVVLSASTNAPSVGMNV